MVGYAGQRDPGAWRLQGRRAFAEYHHSRIAGGTVEAHGAIVLDDARRTSRIEARWANINARRIPAVASLEGTISKSGTAVVEWRADATSASPRFDVIATTGVVASGRTTPIVVHESPVSGTSKVWSRSGNTGRTARTGTPRVG